MTTMIKLLLFVFASSYLMYDGESCCCTVWFFKQWCNCNHVGCNCKGEYCTYAPLHDTDGSECKESDERCADRRQMVLLTR